MISRFQTRRTENEDGFTLIELLIVVVIIGILAAIAIPIFLNQQKAAIQAGVKSDVRSTITSVQTVLTRNPTLGSLAARNGYGGTDKAGLALNTTPASTKIDIPLSDSQTVIQVLGNWKVWSVIAYNGNIVDGWQTWSYRWSSDTGKFVEEFS